MQRKISVFGFEGTPNEGDSPKIILDSSMVEHSAVNRVVAGSSPARGVDGLVVKRLRHRPFTAVTRVRIPSRSVDELFLTKRRWHDILI